ncbi:MAG: hypothetical protein CO128_07580 [Ignavibacteriales bacterium CG_4_9_14_3_um_filter_30_11]|nr:MAG: hypothetical protein CO128_07580 [Ignavibacteriales bacterium CG_4_9_14_3_um_filter_30_11]
MKNEKYALGVDIGGTNIKLGIVSSSGKIVFKTMLPTNRRDGPDEVISQLKKGIKSILGKKKYKIKGIGIGAAGSVSSKDGTVSNPPNVPGWKVVNIVKIIKEEFNVSVFIDNDANAAAIGEMLYGVGKNYSSFALITLGTGVGGGLILNNKIFQGITGAAGEIGHISIDHNGRKCNCGAHGCVEAYVGNHYLIDIVKKELLDHKDSKILELINYNTDLLTPIIINQASEADDKYANDVIEKVGYYVGCALSTVANLLEMDTFIIGGGVSAFGRPLIDSIKMTIKKNVLKILKNRINVLQAQLKNDAGVIGAASLIFYNSKLN